MIVIYRVVHLILSYTILSYDIHILCFSYMYFHILYFHILYFHILFMYCNLYFPYTVIYGLCPFHILLYTMYFSYTVLFHILSSYTFNCILSSHSSAMLLISCHIFYTCHFLFAFMSPYTLEADTENNCMYP